MLLPRYFREELKQRKWGRPHGGPAWLQNAYLIDLRISWKASFGRSPRVVEFRCFFSPQNKNVSVCSQVPVRPALHRILLLAGLRKVIRQLVTRAYLVSLNKNPCFLATIMHMQINFLNAVINMNTM